MFSKNSKKSHHPALTSGKQMPTVIAQDLEVRGDMFSPDGYIDINGRVIGNIEAHTVSLREGCFVSGDIFAENIMIYGSVEGNIEAKNIKLHKTASVKGMIHHGSISIEDGAYIQGQCQRISQDDDEILAITDESYRRFSVLPEYKLRESE